MKNIKLKLQSIDRVYLEVIVLTIYETLKKDISKKTPIDGNEILEFIDEMMLRSDKSE